MISLKDILLEGFDKQSVVDRVYPQIVKNLGRARRGKPKVEFHTNIYARLSGDQRATGEANPHAEYDWDKNKIYLVYCRSGSRSVAACQILESVGIKNVYNLTGGISSWDGDIII